MATPTISNNSPQPGHISWDSFVLRYQADYFEVPAASTPSRWVWWRYNGGNPLLEAGAVIPVDLTDDDLLLFGNKNGIGMRIQATELVDGEMIVQGSIFAEALAANQITSQHISTIGLDAAVIKFGSMSGDRISVNSINSLHIVTQGLDAGVIRFGQMSGDRITANTINTGHIVTTGLDAGVIQFGEMSGDRITANTITATQIASQSIEAEHLRVGMFEALIVQSAKTVSDAVETQGLSIGNQTWNTDTGLTIPDVVNFPPNDATAAKLWARFVARELTIENYLKLQGQINEISQGASLAISNGVTAPTNKPTLVDDWEVVSTFAVPEGPTKLRGLVRHPTDANTWYSTLPVDEYSCDVLKFTNGAIVARRRVTNIYGQDGGCGLAYSSALDRIFVAGTPLWGPRTSSTNPSYASMAIDSLPMDLSSSRQEKVANTRDRSFPNSDGLKFMDMCQIYAFNADYFMIAGYDYLQEQVIGLLYEWANRTSFYGVSPQGVGPINGSPVNVAGITYGTPPGDSASPAIGTWTTWKQGGDPLMVRIVGSGTPSAISRAFGKTIQGAWSNGPTHYTLGNDGKVYKYETGLVTGQVAYSFYDGDVGGTGEHETTLSPTATIAAKRGAGVRVTAVPPPDTGDADAPDRVKVYARAGTSGSFLEQGTILPPAQSIRFGYPINNGVAHGSKATFASAGGAPAKVFSAGADSNGPIIVLNGDGSGRVGHVAWDKNGADANDSGWLTLSASVAGDSPFAHTGLNYARYRRIGKVVHFQFSKDSTAIVDRSTNASGDFTNTDILGAGTIPVGFRPQYNTGGFGRASIDTQVQLIVTTGGGVVWIGGYSRSYGVGPYEGHFTYFIA
jgi:hypothetical protein